MSAVDECGFPGCTHAHVTTTRMCRLHERVTVAANGSWGDTEQAEDQ